MKPSPFEYHAPATAAELVQLLADLGDDAKILAGGQSLVPMLALRLTSFAHLLDIRRVQEIKGIEKRNGSVSIGAGVQQSVIERSKELAEAVPLVGLATPLIGHFQIRNRGTLGGSIAHADPAAEYPAVALTLDAEMEVLSVTGRRTVPASEFFTGLWSNALEPGDLLTGVTFPVWPGRSGFGVEEFARRHGDFAIAGAAVGVQLDDNDRISKAAVGLIGLGSTPERATAVEREVVGTKLGDIAPAEVGRQALAGLDGVPSDLHGSADYRRRVGAAMVERAWAKATTEFLHV